MVDGRHLVRDLQQRKIDAERHRIRDVLIWTAFAAFSCLCIYLGK